MTATPPQDATIDPQQDTSALPEEDDDDPDFAAFYKWSNSESKPVKRKHEPPSEDEDEIKPRPRTIAPAKKTPKTEPKAVDCIRPEYPTIVKDDQGHWVELRCHICGVNYSSESKAFFKGRRGMRRHYTHDHKDNDQEVVAMKMAECMRLASHHVLSKEEVESILAGESGAYGVPAVGGPKKGCLSK